MAGPTVLPGAESELKHYLRFQWCRDQLMKEEVVIVPRLDKETDGRGSTGKLFSETLNTPATISNRIVIFHDPSIEPTSHPDSDSIWLPVTTCTVFYTLGDGVCGFGDICHGGIQSTLLDDVMGVFGIINARLQDGMIPSRPPGKFFPRNNPRMLNLAKKSIATQGIQVDFLRPLRAPTVIQVTVNLKDIEHDGNSFLVHGVIKDGKGREYAKAQARWVVFSGRRKL
ncbi:uncharacterized protein E0L32_001654 [Thyridium curvatum]|uniref:Thioesterase domain-containing protein n=1 Tax=Thyridium curvatum TaxID=1093900 RepID=A0A507ARP9_9PEZI|nr:uncharacterized protein E0L32_001544 [Thyridium curvatum]XP_030990905.1 uncharacterized protein E0L32_001654 [Thyridium curvatum]TPX09084.1 hypothetical protein E0L32_001544 [Thyridium curvatum]TPX09194.1 hypothetical protein E0L32_001654 [Thyridium curvatum]